MWFRYGSDKGTSSNFVKISEKVQQKPWQWLDKCPGKKAWAAHKTHRERKKRDWWRAYVNFLWHQGHCSQRICPGRPNSHFCILLWSFTVTVWKCAKTRPELWQQNWLLHHDNAPSNTSFSTRGFLTRNNMAIVPHKLFSVSPIQDKTERPPFGHKWAETHVVLNTNTEPDFQDAFKRMAESLVTVHTHVEGWLRVWWWPVSPQLIFDQMAAPVPEIMDDSLNYTFIFHVILFSPFLKHELHVLTCIHNK
jgi:hypothetical protein